MSATIPQTLESIKQFGHSYVGVTVTSLLRYLEDLSVLNINDVIDRFSQVEPQVKNLSRAINSDLISALRAKSLINMSAKQMNNIISYLKCVNEDERCSYVMDCINTYVNIETLKSTTPNLGLLKEAFANDIKTIKKRGK